MKIALFHTDGDTWGFGIRLISSILREAGHSTKLIFISAPEEDYPLEVNEQAKEIVSDCDLLGLSCHAYGARRARQLAKCLRSLNKPIIWGGIHATLCPEQCLEYADIVCIGEGEETMLELVERLDAERSWSDVKNLAFMQNGDMNRNELRPLIRNLDKLPVFDFERHNEFHLMENKKLMIVDPLTESSQEKQVFYIGSRGCAFQCTYCCNTRIKELYAGKGRYIRRKSVSNYISELEILYHQHFPRATSFWFMDEDFLLHNVDEIAEFGESYADRIGIPFECIVSAPRITKDKLSPLVRAGLQKLHIGVESGSERTKKEIFNRPISNSYILQASKIIQEYPQVVPRYLFIIANPYESNSDMKDSLKLMTKLPTPFLSSMFNLVLFPGSILYQRAVADGIVMGDDDSACELNFLGGLKYQRHSWKQKNLYLNSLLFLAQGKTTWWSLGFLPRLLLPILLHPSIVQFCNSHSWISEGLIKFKYLMGVVKIRTRLSILSKKTKKILHTLFVKKFYTAK